MSETKTTFVPCKGCHTMIEVPLPDPVQVIKTESCRCGYTEGARLAKYWATAVGMIVVFGAMTIMGGCWVSHHYEADQTRAETEKIKVQTEAQKTEQVRLLDELTKYKNIVEELRKTPSLKLDEKFERPPVDGRAPHPPGK
jgi:hypothetical protein